MNSGVIGLVQDNLQSIDAFENTLANSEGIELNQCVEVRQRLDLSNGRTAIKGRAAKEKLVSETVAEINEGSIISDEVSETKTKFTEFLLVPGEIIIVENGEGTFAFDLISQKYNTAIWRANIDLWGYLHDNDDVDIWQTGFYNTGGKADKGVLYGNQVLDDADFGNPLTEGDLNQLGVVQDYKNHSVKLTLSESGYAEIYQPSSYDEIEYLNYIVDEISPHLNRPK